MKLFTIGYEKRGIEDFIRILKENNINILVDIRAIPHSRNKDYSKKNLERKMSENGIEYLLIKQLGSPRDLRDKVKEDADYDYFFKGYDKYLEDNKEHLEKLVTLAGEKCICLLCYEEDINRCHRRSVAKRMAETGGGFEIINL
jgi:uncharacterized protein (DUF488 family)